MKTELRMIKASIATGFTDVLTGILFWKIGFADWYFERFHFFGIIGLSLIMYGYWSIYFYRKDNNWKKVKW